MLVVVCFNILIIAEVCHSFTPYFHNERDVLRKVKTEPISLESTSKTNASKIPRVNRLREVNNNNSSNPKTYASSLTSDVTRKLTNRNKKELNHNGQQYHSNEPFINAQLLVERRPYQSGSISDILSRYGPIPKSLVNKPGSYQTQLEYQNPTITTTAPPIIATSLKSEIYHPSRVSTTLRKSKRFENSATPNETLRPVHAATLNTEVYHRPQENITDKSERPLMRPAIVLYNQTIVHRNEPKYLHNPSPLRKPRNLREISVDKLIEHKKSEDHETQYEADAVDGEGDDANDDSGDFETVADSTDEASSREEPPLAKHEMRYLHDIFLNYPKTHQANYGHVQLTPEIFEKRFESTKEGNRYKGEVVWMDNKGGYAQHYWNLALGKL